MRKSDLVEIKKLEISGILSRINKFKSEILDLELKKGVKKLANLKEASLKRRALAQMMTILRQKELLNKLEEQNAR